MRKTITYTVPGKWADEQGSRDNGKTFILTELPAFEADLLCTQAQILIAEAMRIQLPDPATVLSGAEELAKMGVNFNKLYIKRAMQSPLLDGFWKCVQFKREKPLDPVPLELGENSQIEELSTLTALKSEVLKLHLGFSLGAEPKNSAASPISTG